MDSDNELPEHIRERLATIVAMCDIEGEDAAKLAMIKLIVESGEQYPVLFDLVSVNEAAVIEHYENTGEVPPGITLIGTATPEGENVTYLEILRGPIPPKVSSEPD